MVPNHANQGIVGPLGVHLGSNLALWVSGIVESFSNIEHLCRSSVEPVIRANVPPPPRDCFSEKWPISLF